MIECRRKSVNDVTLLTSASLDRCINMHGVQRITEFITRNFTYSQAATKSDVIFEAFVPPGRKPMTPPKVDVSAAEASTSLVNNKSVALPTRSPRASGLAIAHSGIMCTYIRVLARTREAYGLVQTGSHDDVYRHKPKPLLRGVSSEFVGLEPVVREC